MRSVSRLIIATVMDMIIMMFSIMILLVCCVSPLSFADFGVGGGLALFRLIYKSISNRIFDRFL